MGTELVPDVDRNGLEAVLSWTKNRRDFAARHYGDQGHQRSLSPRFWGGEIVYQIQMVGRPIDTNRIGFSGQMIEGNQVKVFLPRNKPKTWDPDLQSYLCLNSPDHFGKTNTIP